MDKLAQDFVAFLLVLVCMPLFSLIFGASLRIFMWAAP